MMKEKNCPNCGEENAVTPKKLLVEAFSNKNFEANPYKRKVCICRGNYGIEDLKPEFVMDDILSQFIDGWYCSHCDIGFIEERRLKPAQ